MQWTYPVAVLAIFHTSRSNDETDLGQKVAEPNEIYYSPLTGRLIDSPDKITAATMPMHPNTISEIKIIFIEFYLF